MRQYWRSVTGSYLPSIPPEAQRLQAQVLRTQERMAEAKRYFSWQARMIKPVLGRRVIEVGCGTGGFTIHLSDREAVLATDASLEMVKRARARTCSLSNTTVQLADITSADFAQLREWNADSCVALNVLEHLEDDGGAIKQIASILGPGGRAALFVPSSPALYGLVDANLGHVRRYTKRRLTELAGEAKLEMESLKLVNWLGFFAWWMNAKILRLNELPSGQIQAFDRWVMPWIEPMERFVEPPVGQSLLLIARKKAETESHRMVPGGALS